MQQLDAQLARVVRELRADRVALELDVLVVVDAEPNVDAFDDARRSVPAAAQIEPALLEIDPHRLFGVRLAALLARMLVNVARYAVERVEGVDAETEKPVVAEPGRAERSGFALGRAVRQDAECVVGIGIAGVDVRVRVTRNLVVVAVASARVEVPRESGSAAVEAHGRTARRRDGVAAHLECALETVRRARWSGMRVVTVLTTPPTAPLP